MNLKEYQERRILLKDQEPKVRSLCVTCMQPDFGCYCSHVTPFDPLIEFVILIHPIEVKRRIATGRMSHLSLTYSRLIMGQNYSNHPVVNELLKNPKYHPMVLYPGTTSIDITQKSEPEKSQLFQSDKKLLVFVVDGTWATAKKMMGQSQNLRSLPRFCFTPSQPSAFRVRRQPRADCFSTIEAIHETIELIGRSQGFDVSSRKHDSLLSVFKKMVERQLDFLRLSNEDPSRCHYRREKNQRAAHVLHSSISQKI